MEVCLREKQPPQKGQRCGEGKEKGKGSFSDTDLVTHPSQDGLLPSIHLPDFSPSERSPRSSFKALTLPYRQPRVSSPSVAIMRFYI